MKNRGIRRNVDGIDIGKNNILLLEIKTHGKNPTLKIYEGSDATSTWRRQKRKSVG